jgi:hypothetical protein
LGLAEELLGMSDKNIFDLVVSLPDAQLAIKAKSLLRFNERYTIVRDRIRTLLSANENLGLE